MEILQVCEVDVFASCIAYRKARLSIEKKNFIPPI
jgi:hypothetical protein